MKKNITLFICILILSLNLKAQFSGGSGTAGSPYQVATSADLNNVRNFLTSYFIQTMDIDLTAATSSGGTYYNSGSGWDPIGTISSKFGGNFNGNGFKIIGITINRSATDNVGLFGASTGATISNVILQGGNITGQNYVGGLVGNSNSDVSISGCSNTGNVSGADRIGGLIGYLNSPITNSFTTGNVSGTGVTGGFVAETGSSTYTKCYASGSVTGTSNYVGGFVGLMRGSTSDCYALGNVSGSSQYIGGFGGWNSTGSVTRCYSTGHVPMSNTRQGGFIGFNGNDAVTNCFWDTQTSGTLTGTSTDGITTGVTGKTTAEMKTSTTFTGAGWDFTTVWQITSGYYPDLITNSNTALPVELTSFSAKVIDGKVLLNWHTATEVNNYGFEIERNSINTGDVDDWRNLGFIHGYGNSNSYRNYSFEDSSPTSGKVQYRLKQIDIDGRFEYSDAVEVESTTPSKFTLNQNYPNPFNPETNISFQLANGGVTTLRVYNILGKEVATLVNNTMMAAGTHQVTFDGKNLSSGVYFFVLHSGNLSETRKMILMR